MLTTISVIFGLIIGVLGTYFAMRGALEQAIQMNKEYPKIIEDVKQDVKDARKARDSHYTSYYYELRLREEREKEIEILKEENKRLKAVIDDVLPQAIAKNVKMIIAKISEGMNK